MTTTTKPAATPVASAPAKETIKLLVASNPKKAGSAAFKRFALYKDGMSIAAFKQAVKDKGDPVSLASADLRWDSKHKFIQIV